MTAGCYKIRNDGGFPSDTATTAHDRPHFRRVDIHAVGGTVCCRSERPTEPRIAGSDDAAPRIGAGHASRWR